METIDELKNFIIEIAAFSNYLKLYSGKPNELISQIISETNTALYMLMKICLSAKNHSLFGSEVLAEELKSLFTDYIDKIKAESNNYIIALPEKNVLEFLIVLSKKLNSNSFLDSTVVQRSATNYSVPPEVLKSYINVGQAMFTDVLMTEIKESLQNLNYESELRNPSYYAAIIGPSYMGKTQSAFTLGHLMNVIYLNISQTCLGESAGFSQPIYSLFKKLSDVFVIAFEQDKLTSEYQKYMRTAHAISGYVSPIKCLGLIYVLIRNRMLHPEYTPMDWFFNLINFENIIAPSMTIQQFEAKVAGKQE